MSTSSPRLPRQHKPQSISARDQVTRVVQTLGQLDLSAGIEPTVDASFSTLERIELDDHSWIDLVPGWVGGADAFFQEMARTAPWMQHWRHMYDQVFQEPRFTAEVEPIAESGIQFLDTITDALKAHYGVCYDRLWCNFYSDETKGTSWHADRPADKPPEAIVPLLSLGAKRRFLIKPKAGGRSRVFTPGSGHLLVMGGRAQREWLHSAPKQTKPAGPRISLNFSSSEQNARRGDA